MTRGGIGRRLRTRRALALLMTVAGAAGCTAPTHRPAIDSLAIDYVKLGLALGERDPDAVESYLGPAVWKNDAHQRRAPLEDIARDADALTGRIEAADGEQRRKAFLVGQTRAIGVRARMLGGRPLPVADEARLLFDLPLPTAKQAWRDEAAAIRAEIDRRVPGSGALPDRVAAFERRFLVPRDALERSFMAAVDLCRAAGTPHLGLPADEHVSVEWVRDLAFAAFTRYEGNNHSTVRVSAGQAMPVDRLLDLACHETYPGHHAINVLLDRQQASGGQRPEFQLRLVFSPMSARHEGAATAAALVAFDDAQRLAAERDVLFPLARIDPASAEPYVRVARLVDRLYRVESLVTVGYLDGTLDFARAAAAFESEALMSSPDATLKFLNQYRTYGLAYTLGRDIFVSRLEQATNPSDDRARMWHTYTSLAADLW